MLPKTFSELENNESEKIYNEITKSQIKETKKFDPNIRSINFYFPKFSFWNVQ